MESSPILAAGRVPDVTCVPLRAVNAAPFKAGRVPLAVILAAVKAVKAAPFKAGKVPLAVIFAAVKAVRAAPLRAGRVPLAVMLAAANAVIPAPAPVRVVAATVPATVTVPDVIVIVSKSPAIPILPFPPESRMMVDSAKVLAALHIAAALAVVLLEGTVIDGPCSNADGIFN
jgi:hypothetical protein